MSKYNPLWSFIGKCRKNEIVLSFEEIEKIVGFPIDHSFLKYKNELKAYDFYVDKISMKEQTVAFKKCLNTKGTSI